MAEESFQQQVESAEKQDAGQPAPQPAPQPASVPDEERDAVELDVVDPQGQPAKQKYVPQGALHQARQQAKQQRAEAEQARRDFQALQQQQVAMLQEIQRRSQPQQYVQPVDPNTDPLGATYQQVAFARQETQALNQRLDWEQQQKQAENTARNFMNAVQQSENQFKASHPDYYEAANYLMQKKFTEYTSAGMTEQQARAAIQRDAQGLSMQALSAGANPAERVYEIAKTFGYSPKPNAEAQQEMQRAGQAASTPTSGGGKSGGRLSLDALAKMSPDEFLKATSGDNWRKLMQNVH